MNKLAYLQGYMEKTASPALIKAYRKGLISKEVLEAAVRKLRLKPRFVEDLGQGFEGVAELHTNPRRGFHVEKVYDPDSPLFSEELLKEKRRISTAMNNNPRFADYYGKKKAGLPVTKHEFLEELAEAPAGLSDAPSTKTSILRTSDAYTIPSDKDIRYSPISLEEKLNELLSSKGLSDVRDTYINRGNVINGRIIDFVPIKQEKSANYFNWKKAQKKAISSGNPDIASFYREKINDSYSYPDITSPTDIKRRAYKYKQHE